MYTQGLHGLGGLDSLSKQHAARSHPNTSSSMASYGSIPVTASSADLLNLNRMQTTSAAYGEPSYATATSASPVHATYAASPSPYDGGMPGYAPAPIRSTFALAPESDSRRYSQSGMQQDDRRRDTQSHLPPNNRGRGSTDSYGFPSTHSTSSSISSASNYSSNSYYAGSIDSSPPPAPQSMMGQFSSKVSSSTQKKHKCKVCDKRFTRPSSLQTHMYSHTGEKPFCCEVEGCGRHFSVVSNLRRHRKVHKGDAKSEAGSEDHQDSD
ncbi:hypothetical protein PG990_006173 [Apiospora arundinis]